MQLHIRERPVSDREIRLPTDGFHAPNAGEQFLLGRDSAGVTGEARPMPRAAGEVPAGPEVSLTEQNPAGLAGGESPAGEPARTAEAATPGFSLN